MDTAEIMPFLTEYRLVGIVIGISTFLIIGLFHPIVIKYEYYFGTRCWWTFIVAGIAFLTLSAATDNILLSTVAAVIGASSLWSVGELFEQKKRVERGWFPKRETKPQNKARKGVAEQSKKVC